MSEDNPERLDDLKKQGSNTVARIFLNETDRLLKTARVQFDHDEMARIKDLLSKGTVVAATNAKYLLVTQLCTVTEPRISQLIQLFTISLRPPNNLLMTKANSDSKFYIS